MNTLKVPKQFISNNEPLFDRVRLLNKSGAIVNIDQVNWPDSFPKFLEANVKLAHDNDKLYLLFGVIGEVIRVANNRDFQSVWEDSCVEFFMQKEGDIQYRNFECNANGVMLAAKRTSREHKEHLSIDEMKMIVRESFITHRYDDSKEVSDWCVYMEIPKQVLGYSGNDTLSGKSMRANFYKCGDKTEEPHFLSWNQIATTNPDFHVPEFFGLLEFE